MLLFLLMFSNFLLVLILSLLLSVLGQDGIIFSTIHHCLCLVSLKAFDGVTYHKIHGTPMGSPVSPVLAGLVMEELEISVLASLDFSPIFHRRYVDDIIVCLPTDEIDVFFNAFNNYTPSFNFTIEYQVDRIIPFLEVQIIQSFDGTISTDWYQKSTWSGRYLNFNSHLPISYKGIPFLCYVRKFSDFHIFTKRTSVF
jgi:hypothetical protein